MSLHLQGLTLPGVLVGMMLLAGVRQGILAERPGGKGVPATIQLFQFGPTPIEVGVGTTVTWTNNDEINHTVTSGTPEKRDGRFDGKLSGKGSSFSFDFTQPGTYPYFCARHQSMRGEVVVR